MIIPVKNAREDTVVSGLDVYGMEKLGDILDFFNGIRNFDPVKVDLIEIFKGETNNYDVDFSDVRGQNMKK